MRCSGPDDHSGNTPWRPARRPVGRSSGRGGRRLQRRPAGCASPRRQQRRTEGVGDDDVEPLWLPGMARTRRGRGEARRHPCPSGSCPATLHGLDAGGDRRGRHSRSSSEGSARGQACVADPEPPAIGPRGCQHPVRALLITFHNMDYANWYDTWIAAAAHRWSLIFWSLIMWVRLEHHQPFDSLAHCLSSAVRADAGGQTASWQQSLNARTLALPRHPSSASHGR